MNIDSLWQMDRIRTDKSKGINEVNELMEKSGGEIACAKVKRLKWEVIDRRIDEHWRPWQIDSI